MPARVDHLWADKQARKRQAVVGERSGIKPLPAWLYPFWLLDGHKSLKALCAKEIHYEFRICFLVWKGELTTIMNQQEQMECPWLLFKIFQGHSTWFHAKQHLFSVHFTVIKISYKQTFSSSIYLKITSYSLSILICLGKLTCIRP